MTLHPDIERVALLGWHLYPSSRKSRAGMIKSGTQRATCNLDQLAAWSREFPQANWRVVFGPSGIWGLDCDTTETHAHDGVAKLAALVKAHGPLPQRPTMRSGGGGLGLFFRHYGERIVGEAGHPGPGIDPRRGAQSQTIPPSIHITTGRPYRWLASPWETPIPAAPEWLLKLVEVPPDPPKPAIPRVNTTDTARRALAKAVNKVMEAGEGRRNDTLNGATYRVARFVGARLLGETEAVEALYAAARQTGLDHSEIKLTIQSAFSSGFARPVETTWDSR